MMSVFEYAMDVEKTKNVLKKKEGA